MAKPFILKKRPHRIKIAKGPHIIVKITTLFKKEKKDSLSKTCMAILIREIKTKELIRVKLVPISFLII